MCCHALGAGQAEDRSALAGALVAVAAPLRALGRRRAAAPLLRLALDWRVRAGGRHHTAALLAAGNLAVLLQDGAARVAGNGASCGGRAGGRVGGQVVGGRAGGECV